MACRVPRALVTGLTACLRSKEQQAGASSLQRLLMMQQPHGAWLPPQLLGTPRSLHSQHGQPGTAEPATAHSSVADHSTTSQGEAGAISNHGSVQQQQQQQPTSSHAQLSAHAPCSLLQHAPVTHSAVSHYYQHHHLPHIPPAALPTSTSAATTQQNRAVWSAVVPALEDAPAQVPTSQPAQAPSAWRTALLEWQLLDKAAYSQGWAQHITWSRAAIAAAMAVAFAELLLLPACAPGGTSLGSTLAEGLWSTVGMRTDLGSLLMGSSHLELVQAFSFTRKLAQAAVLGVVLHAVTRGRIHGLFNVTAAQPMHKQHGWYRWACFGIAGLAVVSCMFQAHGMLLDGMDSVIQMPSAAGLHEGPSMAVAEQATVPAGLGSGDERTLPFRCRWFAESCVLTPMLEEAVFRGFLLTSLSRYMPVWGALAGSSAAFAACHLSAQAGLFEQLQLAASGCVLGLVFLRSRNLLAPITAHAMNNSVAWVQQNL